MRTSPAPLALLALPCAAALPIAPTNAQQFFGLGDLDGGAYESRATAISADGSTIVGFSHAADGIEAFRWTQSEGMVGLGDLFGGIHESVAQAVNTDGTAIVGYSESGNGTEAFWWTPGLGMFPIGDIPGGDFASAAFDVSADGEVVVGFCTPPIDPSAPIPVLFVESEAFRWTFNGGIERLGDFPAPTGGPILDSVANGVNDAGDVVVGYGYDQLLGQQACQWVVGPTLIGLGGIPSNALDISADGSVIVGVGNFGGTPEAFRITPFGSHSLGRLPSAGSGNTEFAVPKGLCASGNVVVGEQLKPGLSEAFIWTISDGIRSLEDVLNNDHGIDTTGWTLMSADGVSGGGRLITGWGINPQGFTEAFAAFLPLCRADTTTTNANPGDINHGVPDCTINGADLSYFVEQWLDEALPISDVTTTGANPGDPGYGVPDGTVNGADISWFVEAWLDGCD